MKSSCPEKDHNMQLLQTKYGENLMKRNSKFELLRILSMVMIIMSHYQLYGKVRFEYSKILAPLGQIGVGIFVMISAYFLVTP